MSGVLFYFTATGNTLRIAKEIADSLGGTKLVRITAETECDFGGSGFSKAGIFFPIYKGRPPRLVREFLSRLILPEDAYIYSVMTCDAHYGDANMFVRDILGKNGMTLRNFHAFLMPASNMTRRPPETEGEQAVYFKNIRFLIPYVIASIHKEESRDIPDPSPEVQEHCREVDAEFDPYRTDVNFLADEKCTGCGLCSKVCPAANIVIKDGRPEWQHRCERCTACLQLCPAEAIQFTEQTTKWGRYHNPDIKVGELVIPGRK